MRLPFNSCKDVVTHVNETSLCSDTACRLTEMSRSDVFVKTEDQLVSNRLFNFFADESKI